MEAPRRSDGDTLDSVLVLSALVFFIAEIAAFVAVGEHIGFGWAVLILLVVSALGPLLIRRAGFGVLLRTQERLAHGELPTRELLDGVVLLLGGAMVCIPGFLSDALGLLLLIGYVRHLVIRAVGHHVARKVQSMRPDRWRVINVGTGPDAGGMPPSSPSSPHMIDSGNHTDT